MSATDFTTEQVDRAIDYVFRHGAENRAAPVHYTLVFAEAGLPAPRHLHQCGEPELVTRFMEAFHVRCIEPLHSLVENVAGERAECEVPDTFGSTARRTLVVAAQGPKMRWPARTSCSSRA